MKKPLSLALSPLRGARELRAKGQRLNGELELR
jgi:hypothetical protein